MVCWRGCTKQCHFFSWISWFLVHLFRFGLAWHFIGIYHSAILLCLEPHNLHKASIHLVIWKLMHHFYLQCPPTSKWFGPWDVECLSSLLDSWTLASSLTTFKLAWKIATLLAVVTVKYCSDLTLLCFDNKHFFLQHYATVFIPVSGGKMDWLGHLPPQIPILYWTFSEEVNWISCVLFVFWITIGSTCLCVFKMISSQIRKF